MNHRIGISFLYTNVGRGHPFYLDGIAEELSRSAQSEFDVSTSDVFEVSSGASLLAWIAVRWLYCHGSSGGLIGEFYSRLRRGTGNDRQSNAIRILGRELRRRFFVGSEPLLVAHPILVSILAGRPNLIYQHGELVVPLASQVAGADTVFVPTESAAQSFRQAGSNRPQVLVTGLCIESNLATRAESDYSKRLKRLSADSSLTGFFVSSGAEPSPHVRALVSSVTSVVTGGHRAVVLAREGGRLEQGLLKAADRHQYLVTHHESCVEGPGESPCILASYRNRREENDLTSDLFSRVDYLVAPPHERTNWAIGLGLPMLALTPAIGPFAPLNLRLVLESGVAETISEDEAPNFATRLSGLQRSGKLVQMAHNGWGHYDLDGFARIAELMRDRFQ